MPFHYRLKKGYGKVKGYYHKQKKSYTSYAKTPTIGERALAVGRKIQRLPKQPKFKKIRKRAIGIRSNIDYFFRN